MVVVCNFTPVPRHGYRVGVPLPGYYRERLNTDAAIYGGANIGNGGGVMAEELGSHGRPCSLSLTLPPLATVFLERMATRATPSVPVADVGLGSRSAARARC